MKWTCIISIFRGYSALVTGTAALFKKDITASKRYQRWSNLQSSLVQTFPFNWGSFGVCQCHLWNRQCIMPWDEVWMKLRNVWDDLWSDIMRWLQAGKKISCKEKVRKNQGKKQAEYSLIVTLVARNQPHPHVVRISRPTFVGTLESVSGYKMNTSSVITYGPAVNFPTNASYYLFPQNDNGRKVSPDYCYTCSFRIVLGYKFTIPIAPTYRNVFLHKNMGRGFYFTILFLWTETFLLFLRFAVRGSLCCPFLSKRGNRRRPWKEKDCGLLASKRKGRDRRPSLQSYEFQKLLLLSLYLSFPFHAAPKLLLQKRSKKKLGRVRAAAATAMEKKERDESKYVFPLNATRCVKERENPSKRWV